MKKNGRFIMLADYFFSEIHLTSFFSGIAAKKIIFLAFLYRLWRA